MGTMPNNAAKVISGSTAYTSGTDATTSYTMQAGTNTLTLNVCVDAAVTAILRVTTTAGTVQNMNLGPCPAGQAVVFSFQLDASDAFTIRFSANCNINYLKCTFSDQGPNIPSAGGVAISGTGGPAATFTPSSFLNGSITTAVGVVGLSVIYAIDNVSNTIRAPILVPDTTATNSGSLAILPTKRAGFMPSLRGRRYTFGTADLTGVAAATALTLTAPTWLLVAGATNEQVLRRLTISLPLIGTSTTFQVLIKSDTADRFSAGGTTRTPATLNNGNVIAWSGSRSLEAPTATAEGGGTRVIYRRTGQIVSGSAVDILTDDACICAAAGSLLIYVVTATAGATIHLEGEIEDTNVQ